MSKLVLILAISYVLGSIPFGYLLVRIFRGEDVRLSGSGNIGATNVSRKSPALGALTLILDAAKGFAAVQFAALYCHQPARLQLMMAASALFAIIGHMFPIWLKFRGGKGVATALGAFLRFSPMAVLVATGIFVLSVLISRRISLGSIVAAALFPSTVWALRISRDPATLALLGLAALLIIIRHYQNILRLLAGEEPPFSMKPKL
ncbi:MAG TPA: glycerol-3-phosphate 1-O-acyltransferase PlsY [Candidatus Eisenbacteria bacterium]|nr:glycerol-3-phosphate 1-O-acyltransferase PlsY [Candidatus Eisenbacteria bacterium]